MTILEQKAEQRRNLIQALQAEAEVVAAEMNSLFAETLGEARAAVQQFQGV